MSRVPRGILQSNRLSCASESARIVIVEALEANETAACESVLKARPLRERIITLVRSSWTAQIDKSGQRVLQSSADGSLNVCRLRAAGM